VTRFAGLAGLATIAVALAGCGGTSGTPARAFRGTLLAPPQAAPRFTLRDQAGEAAGLPAAAGRYVVVAFLYTHCPDVCPVIAGTLNRVLEAPAGRRARLEVLGVSVDPKGDTPPAVRRFIREHQLVPAFRYLTGTRPELAAVWKAFHVASVAGPRGILTHSSFEILIDPQGRERLIYDSTVTTAAVVHDLGVLQGTV
jgi:protein SCO1/2